MDLKPPHELLNFRGKSVIVTGASVGIGAGIARRFAQAGADVVLHYHTHRDEAQTVAEQIGQLTGSTARVRLIQGNVTVALEVSRLFDETIAAFGKVDALINNAGNYPITPLLEMTEAQWDNVVDTNLKSVFLCTQAAARHMVQRGEGGAIINIASIESFNPAPNHSHYVAAKAGVVMFSQTAALELGQYGIRINVVAPGLINAPALPTAWPEGVARWLNRAPLKRLGEAEDVADACLFLASDGARWISGSTLIVDGGVMTNQIF
jgi:NAD(P)-dependent dehydrogenase (short-subunit alcohol dehydrogenase family)